MKYNFDEIVPRSNTASVKYDLRKEIFGDPDLIPMWVADMDFKTPDFVVEAIKNRLDHEILGYSIRTDTYYDSIINWNKRRHNWNIHKEWISFSPGVVPGVNMAVLAYSEPNDEIIVQPPVYFPFFTAVENHNRKLVYNQLVIRNNRYCFDFEDLERKAKTAKILILSNPHNPGGSVWTKDELKRLADICERNDVLIFTDEIHGDLVFNRYKYVPLASLDPKIADRTITFIAPSKTFNLAGLSTSSVIITNEDLKKKFDKVMDDIHVGNGNVLGAIASQAAYDMGDDWLDQLMTYLDENLLLLVDFIKNEIPQIIPMPPEGTYLVWLDCSKLGMTATELKHLFFRKARIAVNEGSMFGPGGEGFVRINIACPKQILLGALMCLKNAIQSR